MKLHKLKEIVEGVNLKALSPLAGHLDLDNGKASVCLSSSSLPDHKSDHSFGSCGFTKSGMASDCDFVKRWLMLKSGVGVSDSCCVAVGAAIDAEPNINPENDMPVILAVGINYGQDNPETCHYATHGVPIIDETKLRAKLTDTFERLHAQACMESGPPARYHLVAANFFPWITNKSWSELGLNSIEESALIHSLTYTGSAGQRDPALVVTLLINELLNAGERFHSVVFHGANNAVPYLGAQTVAFYPELFAHSQVIYCDNLSRGKVVNAVLRP